MLRSVRARVLLVAAALVSLCGPLHGQAGAAEAAGPPVDALRPGDALRISVWREEDLSGEFPVDSRGKVVLPLLGERDVTRMSIAGLRDALLADYRTLLRNPSITIIPLRRVNVLGYVTKPGLYSVDPTVSLAGAIGFAGGANPEGDLRRIRILREGRVIQQRVDASAALNTVDVRSGDEIFVERRGWLERNTSLVVSTLISATGILITLLTRN
jgi:protein involved in polysaccharide export with SLBB domain